MIHKVAFKESEVICSNFSGAHQNAITASHIYLSTVPLLLDIVSVKDENISFKIERSFSGSCFSDSHVNHSISKKKTTIFCLIPHNFNSFGFSKKNSITFFGVYLPNVFDIPNGDDGYYPKKHSKKKNKSARIRYENTKNPVVERPIPKNKKKKYPTKPKNNSKINKVKESRGKYM